MKRCDYSLGEVRAARRLLEDLELGRWPRNGAAVPAAVPALNEPKSIVALYEAGELLRAVEHNLASARPVLYAADSAVA